MLKKAKEAELRFIAELDAVSPYNFELSVHEPSGWHWLTPLEQFSDGVIWTAMRLSSEKLVGLRMKFVGTVEHPRISLSIFSEEKLDNGEEREALNKVFFAAALREDITEFYSIVEGYPFLRQAKKDLYGMRCVRRIDLFGLFMTAISLQDAPINRSTQMMNLLLQTYGQRTSFDRREVVAWPTPQRISKATVEELKEKCKLGFRAKYLKSAAEAICSGRCSAREELRAMPPEGARERLMELEGIGEYSAGIISPHPDFSVDAWSAPVFAKIFFPKESVSAPLEKVKKRIKEYAEENFGRWRGYAWVYIINDLDNIAKRLNIKLM